MVQSRCRRVDHVTRWIVVAVHMIRVEFCVFSSSSTSKAIAVIGVPSNLLVMFLIRGMHAFLCCFWATVGRPYLATMLATLHDYLPSISRQPHAARSPARLRLRFS